MSANIQRPTFMNIRIRTATTAQTPEELLNDLRTLVSDAELMLNRTPDENRRGSPARLQERFDAAQKRLGELYNDTKVKIIAGAKHTDSAIRANPYRSLAIALGAGLLIGVLVGRRGK